MEGVRSVLTASDLPDPMPRCGPAYNDRPVLAVGETKFSGEPVVAIAAETEDAAEAAAAAIRIDSEELPAVLSVDQALDPAAPLVQDPAIRADSRLAHTNILQEWRFGWGEPDVAADCVDRERLHVSDGHALCHRAARVHGGTGCGRGDHLEFDPASLRAPARRGVRARVARLEGPRHFAGSRRRLRRQGLAQVRAADGIPRAAHGPRRPPGADAGGNISARPPDLCPHPRAQWIRQDGSHCLPGHPRRLPDRRVRGHGWPRRQQGQLRGVRSLPHAACPGDRARAAVAHDAEHRLPRLRHAAGVLGRRVPAQCRGRGTRASIASTSADAIFRARERRSSRAIRRPTATGRARSSRPVPRWDRLARAAAEHRGRGISLGLKSSSTASASFAIVRMHYDGSARCSRARRTWGRGRARSSSRSPRRSLAYRRSASRW